MPTTKNKPASTEDQLAAEQKAFERQKPQLLRRYEGQFVAFYGGKMIDHDKECEALAARMYAKFGEVPWWIARVEKHPTIYDLPSFDIIDWFVLNYDHRYRPPAPVADMVVINPSTGKESPAMRGKLDTGAGLSVIPQRLVGELGLISHSDIWARGYDGTHTHRPIYFARFILDGHKIATVECAAAERETVLVGRNVLNQFIITLDGKNLRFDLKRV